MEEGEWLAFALEISSVITATLSLFGNPPMQNPPRSQPKLNNAPWLTLVCPSLSPFCPVVLTPFSGFFKGTSADQDRRFSDKELKLLKTLKFPPQFDTKVLISFFLVPLPLFTCHPFFFSQVDMRKVNLQVIRPWVTKKVVELLGLDDELVVEYAMGLLEDESQTVKSHPSLSLPIWPFGSSSCTDSRSQKNADQPHWFSH